MIEIAVGDCIHLDTWKPGDKLWSDWVEKDPEYIKSLNPSEEILSPGEYALVIDYPLSKPYRETFTIGKWMTREQMVEIIVDRYHKIYNDEDASSTNKAALIPGMMNRVHTDGNYGIWGHTLDDLDLHTIWIDEYNVITLGVDS